MKHVLVSKKRWISSAVFACLFLVVPAILETFSGSFMWAWERAQPPEYWYEYHSVTLATEGVPKGDVPKFVTDATYHQVVDIRWEDTLWCIQTEGIKKYPTQEWPQNGTFERSILGNTLEVNSNNGQLPFWEYTAASIDADAMECKLLWKAIVLTSTKRELPSSGETDWFKVNM